MKAVCPACREEFDVDKNTHEEGDLVDCPECGESCVIAVRKGKFVLKTEKSKYDDGDDFYGDDYDE